MELRHLRYFIAVAEEGSLTLAAEKRLHTAQPSLSRQIRDLEYEVGVQLMSRSVHGIELTAAGKAFLDHARLALTQADAAKEAARRAVLYIRLTFSLQAAYFFRAGSALRRSAANPRGGTVRYFFENYALDTDRRELQRGTGVVPNFNATGFLSSIFLYPKKSARRQEKPPRARKKGRILISCYILDPPINPPQSDMGVSRGKKTFKKTPPEGFFFCGGGGKKDPPPGPESVPDSRFESSTPALALPDKPSIAVLPFENMSGDPEQEYFADGMVEEIITALSRFKWLFVIARNSSFTFKGKAVDIKEVGRRLGVRYVLEGSVRKASGKVRITGQLIDAVTGAHIWADRFERDLTDIFALQDEVTVAVVSAIQPKLLQTEIAMATRRRPENLTAYDFYLRAMQQYYLSTREGLAEAIRLAHRALELDPRFGGVAALAGICHMHNVLWGYAVDPQFDRKEAVRLLRLALSLDDGDPETLARAALISAFMVGDCESEIEMADRAVALNPNSFRAWNCRGWVYKIAGLPEEAIRSFERAIRMSPVDPRLHRTFVGMGIGLY